MFGMFSIDAAEGFMERRDNLDTRRSDIARRFNEYRKANPYATALDLQNYADSLVGSDFFLRPGNATGDALQNIAKQNKINRNIRDRGQVLDALEQDTKLSGQVTDIFTRQFKMSGDAEAALQSTKDIFMMDKPGDPRMDSIINNSLSALESGKDALVQNIVYQGLGEFADQIKAQMQMGIDEETVINSLPPHLRGELAESFVKSQATLFDQAQRDTVFGLVPNLMNDQVLMNSLGAGDFSAIKERLGPERFDKYDQDGQLTQHIESLFNTYRQESWNEDNRKNATAAIERGTARLSSAIDRQATAFAGYNDADNDKDRAAAIALSLLSASYVIAPSADAKIVRILENNTSSDPNAIVSAIQAELGPGELLNQQEFIQREAGQYLNMMGLGGQEPQTFLDWKSQNLGPNGQIPRQVEIAIENTSSALGSTSSLYGGTNQFGLVTPTAYQQHMNDLANAIAMSEQTKDDLGQSRRAIRNGRNFLGSFRTGQNGESVNVGEMQREADKQLFTEEDKIDKHIIALREKLKAVKEDAILYGRTDRPFNSFTGPQIQAAAQAMARYASGAGQTTPAQLRKTANMYAAMMGVRGGTQTGLGSQDQKQLADALLAAMP